MLSDSKPAAISGGRLLIWTGVVALHAAALFGLSMDLRPTPVMVGGAPVIQLTLTPRASFDGVNAPKISKPSSSPTSASAERNAIGSEGSAPEKPTPRPSTSTTPSFGPTTISARPP